MDNLQAKNERSKIKQNQIPAEHKEETYQWSAVDFRLEAGLSPANEQQQLLQKVALLQSQLINEEVIAGSLKDSTLSLSANKIVNQTRAEIEAIINANKELLLPIRDLLLQYGPLVYYFNCD